MGAYRNRPESIPEFNYHLLRNALDGYQKNLSQLAPDEHDQVYRRAQRSFEIESLVLASREASEIIVSREHLDRSMQEVASRYESRDDLIRDLEANHLDEDSLRRALYRELLFDHAMQRVAAKSPEVNELDMRLFYELHSEKFITPEQRTARHILITVNPEFQENTREAAQARIEEIVQKLRGRTNRFASFAKRYSECPTAVEGGRLGDLTRGQLYPELDVLLFSMRERQIGPIVESEMGFHILYCEKIRPGKKTPFSKAAPRIREVLTERQKRNCQKAWLSSLKAHADG